MYNIRAIAGMSPSTMGRIVFAFLGIVLAVGVASPAGAAIPTRVTVGQAQAVFQTQFTAGVAIESNPAEPAAAPLADNLKPVVMSPISSVPTDPFCVLDWHVIRVLLSSDDRTFLADSNVRIQLDGAALAITTTAVKPVVHFPGIYVRSYGVVVPPGTPTVGLHTLTAQEDFADGTPETDSTTITVGSAASPACTGS